jgi:hypothetical protein
MPKKGSELRWGMTSKKGRLTKDHPDTKNEKVLNLAEE